MAGYIVKKYTTIIMDGSNAVVNRKITRIIDAITEKIHGESIYRQLDEDHPTMIVIETETISNAYEQIKEVLSIVYPGLCVFNPPM